MNILFTICGRAGSKGFKNKNTKLFLKFPLVYYTLSTISLYSKIHEKHNVTVAVNTDSVDLKKQISNYPIDVVFIDRKEELAGDVIGKIDVISDTFKQAEQKTRKMFDIIIDLDITSPLRTVEDINNIIEKSVTTDHDIVFSVTESRRNPYFNMVIHNINDDNYSRVVDSRFNSRQEAGVVYDMNASIYAYKPWVLKSKTQIFDNNCGIILMKDTGVLDIDSNEDFELMQVIAQYLYFEYEDFSKVRDNIVDDLGANNEV